jgi:hypothetical protein
MQRFTQDCHKNNFIRGTVPAEGIWRFAESPPQFYR